VTQREGVPVEDAAVGFAAALQEGEARSGGDRRRAGVRRFAADDRLGAADPGRVGAGEAHRAGGEAAAAPLRVEAVGEVGLALAQVVLAGLDVHGARERQAGLDADAEVVERPAFAPPLGAGLEVVAQPLRGGGAAVEPARHLLVLPREVGLEVVGAEREERDRAVGERLVHASSLAQSGSSRNGFSGCGAMSTSRGTRRGGARRCCGRSGPGARRRRSGPRGIR
jgi:hypothetical protein